jgi:hypothetical protein
MNTLTGALGKVLTRASKEKKDVRLEMEQKTDL